MKLALFCLCVVFPWANSRVSEQERAALWRQKNTWPPQWQDETPAMKAVLEHREKQIMNITYSDERWENWLQYTQQRLVPKFTTHGFEVATIPANIFQKLSSRVARAIKKYDQLPFEGKIDVIYSNQTLLPKFISMWDVALEVHQDLLGVHEKWAGKDTFLSFQRKLLIV